MTAILVTRPSGPGDQLVGELERRGYRVRAVPAVATRPVRADWPDLASYDWIAVTSAAGAGTIPASEFGGRWAAVGGATARALGQRGIEVDVVPPDANGASLARAMPVTPGARVLFVRGATAAGDLPRGLRARGATVDEIVTYETVEGPAESREPLSAALEAGDVAAVVFASGSAVRGFVALGGPTSIPAVTIGLRTSEVALALGFRVAGQAGGQSAAELAAAVERVIPIEVGPDA
jgi:uroporphyrinogen-III synthase